ncbi:MAG: hypothetical protein J6T70_09285 [Bacteroidales bacterium]|nr:hypothetical protein [Bacteroidales bacterium]
MKRIFYLIIALISILYTSCGFGTAEEERMRADSLENLLMQYMDSDNQKSLMLLDYEQSISTFGNFLDSIKIREMAIDSLKSVIKRKGNSGKEAQQIKELVRQIQLFIDRNQGIADDFKDAGYKNASAQQLVNLMLSTIDNKQKEVAGLKTELSNLKIKVKDLEEENAGLVQEIAVTNQKKAEAENEASQLSLSNVKITLPDVRKAKKVDSVNIKFAINENKFAPTGEVTVYVRISDQKGVILRTSESGMFDYLGSEIAYTAKKSSFFSGKKTPMNLTWHTDGITLTPGQYTVTFFMNGAEADEASFVLKK